MGRVWRGEHRRQGIDVAVKVLAPSGVRPKTERRLFRREIQAHARLLHPGIARIFDHGLLPAEATVESEGLIEGRPYFAMEYADAGTLRDHLPGDWASTRGVLTAMLDGLAHAHARDVFHRDIKPENLLHFDERGEAQQWKLTDFGVAYALDRVSSDDGQESSLASAGTPAYMPPEQLRGEWRRFGPWTDLYQIGCVAFELVCRRTPFSGETAAEVALAHLSEPFPALDAAFPVPDGFEAWVARLTRKEPGARFKTAAGALAALTRLDSPERAADRRDSSRADRSAEATTRREVIPPTERLTTLRAVARTAEARPDEPVDEATGGAADPSDDPASVPVAERIASANWREERRDLTPTGMSDVGLSLFGLREIPFVDRDAERQAIWDRLTEAVTDARGHVVLVEGASGTGRTRLVEWIARRARELGLVREFRITHNERGGSGDGLAGMLERWARSWQLEGEECRGLLETRLRDSLGPESEAAQMLSDELEPLLEWIRPSTDATDPESATFGAVYRLLERSSQARPVLIRAEDLQEGPATCTFLQFLLEFDPNWPFLVLGTVREESEQAREHVEQLPVLRKRDDVTTLELQPLRRADQETLIHRLLPLDAPLAERLLERTEGHPLFAVQLLGEWVERDLLEPGPDGFHLTDEPDELIPADIHQLWRRRIERALRQSPDQPAHEAWQALELAATLGRHFERQEWRTACGRAGLLAPTGLVDGALVDQRLVERDAEGWHFTHRLLVESLRQRARDAGRLTAYHRLCAETIDELYPGRLEEMGERQANHWVEAGEPLRAVAPLHRAAERVGNFEEDLARQLQMLERAAEFLEQGDVDAEDRRWVQNWTALAKNHQERGEMQEAKRLARRAQRTALDEQWTDMYAEATRRLFWLVLAEGDLDRALACSEEAEAAFRESGDEKGVIESIDARGTAYRQMSRFEEARELFERARTAYQKLDLTFRAGACLWSIARCWFAEGRIDRAEEYAERLRSTATEHGIRKLESAAENTLGELARTREQWRDAIDHYRRARRLWGRAGSRAAFLATFNLALSHIGARHWRRAGELLEGLDEDFRNNGFEARRPHVFLGRAVCAAGLGEWEVWAENLETYEQLRADGEVFDPDTPWLAELGAEVSMQAGRKPEAHRMWRLAAADWEALGRDEDARRVRSKLP